MSLSGSQSASADALRTPRLEGEGRSVFRGLSHGQGRIGAPTRMP